MTAPALVEHFFRHEYGRQVAMLSRRLGVEHLETIEDAVQSAMMKALESWTVGETPDRPGAWIYRVAMNRTLGELRKESGRSNILARRAHEIVRREIDPPDCPDAREIRDDVLRMMFVCCDESVPVESQLVLALKTLCGFSVREIALRLFTSEANVYKRLARARDRLRERPLRLEGFDESEYAVRVPDVQRILYLLFTEGHFSSNLEWTIRRELVEEAIRLTSILADHPAGRRPSTWALLALMHLHAARMPARQDDSGGLLLLEEQNRGAWNQDEIKVGLEMLAASAEGDKFTRYHAEAGIAAEHCLAPSFEETRWDKIVECYALLDRIAPSPVHKLNCAVALAEWKGPDAGLAMLRDAQPPSWLTDSYMWSAVLADLHRRSGNLEEALRYRKAALATAPNAAVRALLDRRLKLDR